MLEEEAEGSLVVISIYRYYTQYSVSITLLTLASLQLEIVVWLKIQFICVLKYSALEHAGLNTIGHGHSASILSYSLRLCAQSHNT